MTNHAHLLTVACAAARRHDDQSWSSGRKSYGTTDAAELAQSHRAEILRLRSSLVDLVVDAIADRHDGHLLTVVNEDAGKLGNGRYQPFATIDLHHAEALDGTTIRFTKVPRKDSGLVRPNTFRIWFTSAGVGIGIHAVAGSADHARRLSGLRSLLPSEIVDLEPSNSGWDRHPLEISGIRSRRHIYLADWHRDFGDDEAFASAIGRTWETVGGALWTHRL